MPGQGPGGAVGPLGRLIEVGSGRGSAGRREFLSPYSNLWSRPSFRSFLAAGALQFAAPSTVLVILVYTVPFSYPAPVREMYGALALAFLGLSSAVPTFVTAVFSGALADRFDRGRLMRAANLVSLIGVAAAAAVLIVAPSTHIGAPGPAGFYIPLRVLLLYPCWAVIVTTATLFRPAYNTCIPRVVEPKDLGRANGLIYASASILSVAGTLGVGAMLTFYPEAYALEISFLLFFATQVALQMIDVDLSVNRTSPKRSVVSEAKEGFVYLGHRRELLQITVAALVVNFLSAVALVELGLYVANWLDLSQGIWFGAMVAASTVGVAVGFTLIPRFHFEPYAGRAIIFLTVAMGLSLLGLGLVRSIWLALPVIFVYGMMPGMIMTVFLSTVQATVPDAMMGRVFSADEVGSYALVPFGQTAGGLLTVGIGIQGTYLAAGGAIVVFGLVMVTTFRALRRLGYHPREAEPAPVAVAS